MFDPLFIVAAVTFHGLLAVILTPQVLGLVAGGLTPLVLSVLNQPFLSKAQKHAVALVGSGAVGLLTVYLAGQFDTSDLVTTLPLVYAACQAAYHLFWKPSGVTSTIEDATSVSDGEVVENYDAPPPANPGTDVEASDDTGGSV